MLVLLTKYYLRVESTILAVTITQVANQMPLARCVLPVRFSNDEAYELEGIGLESQLPSPVTSSFPGHHHSDTYRALNVLYSVAEGRCRGDNSAAIHYAWQVTDETNEQNLWPYSLQPTFQEILRII